MKPDAQDALFTALAHATRRRMLDLLVGAPGMGVAALASHFEISRIAVQKHLKVLGSAGLVLSKKRGRTRHLYFNAVPIQQMYDRWSDQYGAFWSERLVDLKDRVESRAQAKKNRRA